MAYATEEFLKTIDNEIKEFRENYASFLFPEAVYKDYYIIFFIESYFNMFFSTADEISEDVICWLNKQKIPLSFYTANGCRVAVIFPNLGRI